jgi:hypothetical protein
MGRIQQAKKNIAFGFVSNFVILFMNFLQRTIFILILGQTLTGVNSLFSGILSMLSMAELGIGSALNYSLYKPVANKDYEKIKSYMLFYKKAYRVIAAVITVIGLALTPFLKYLVKNPGDNTIQELTVYYLIFLFNTVSTYFVAYKYSLVNAEQRNYIQTNITTITKIVTVIVQIVVLLLTRNFLIYLLAQAAVELLQKIFVSRYLNRLYPYLCEKKVQRLEKEETAVIVTKTKALMCHKIGDVARLQTDSIIISSFIDVGVNGIVDNYNYVITYVANFVNIIFNSVLSGFGNLVATESKEKQYEVFKVYRFFACWLYGFATVGFWYLLTPLIGNLWLNDEWVIGQGIVTLILIDFYFKGGRVVLANFKIAAGVFEKDRYLALIQGGVNLVLSIGLVQVIGLSGIYVGTVVSGLMANVVQPLIVYHDCFERKAISYFIDSLKYLCIIVGITLLLLPVKAAILQEVTFLRFLGMAVVITLVYNGVFWLAFGRSGEFRYLFQVVAGKFVKKK